MVSPPGIASCAGWPVCVTCSAGEAEVDAVVAAEAGCAVAADGYTIVSPSDSEAFFSEEAVDPVAARETESTLALGD